MARRLTKKERGFVKDVLRTDNATIAALNNYNITNNDKDVAAAVGSEVLRRPKIQKAIAEALPDDLLAERHLELLNKREVIRLVGGRGVVIDQPETNAVKAGLDMAYKIKGSYAAEKHINISVEITKEERERARKALEE